MIYLLNILIYLLTPLGSVISYCSLLRIAFDAIFGALLFLQYLFHCICFFLCSLGFFLSVISLCGTLGCGMWVIFQIYLSMSSAFRIIKYSLTIQKRLNYLQEILKAKNDALYADLNRINQEVKTATENYVYAMEESREDNLLYLAPLLEIIVDVNIMMNNLYEQDVQLFLFKQGN